MALTSEKCLEILCQVSDPEIPTLSIVDLGIVRDVAVESGAVRVRITPTYSGCPAMKMIEQSIVSALEATGEVRQVFVETVLHPPWTTDWITDEGKRQLKASAIAPPEEMAGDKLVFLPSSGKSVACPFCGSSDTELRSQFGATACKALYFCASCTQPFEYFKPF